MWGFMRCLSALPAVDRQSIVLLKKTDGKTYFSQLKEGSSKIYRDENLITTQHIKRPQLSPKDLEITCKHANDGLTS